jgi:ubiquinone biosynthesis protein UbiJ
VDAVEVDMVGRKMAAKASLEADVDEAASRVMGEVAATEMVRAVAVDMRLRRARHLPSRHKRADRPHPLS